MLQHGGEATPLVFSGQSKSSIFPPATKRKRINLLAVVINLFAPWFATKYFQKTNVQIYVNILI